MQLQFQKKNKITCQANKHIVVLLIIFISLTSATNAYSQGIGRGGGGNSDRIDGKVKFMPVPYFGYDRALGYSIGALPMLMFNPSKKDTLSPSSLVGALGILTENDTWFLMGFGSFYFAEDKWRSTIAGGTGEVNYQFFLEGIVDLWIPYNAKIDFLHIGIERKIIEKLYGGINFTHMQYATNFGSGITVTDSSSLNTLGFSLSFDKRKSHYYPKGGYKTSIKFNNRPGWMGNDNASKKIEIDWNYYSALRADKDVIATRAFIGLGIGDLIFNDQFIVGQTDVRGYSQGEYRGNHKIAIQSEYRWNFHKRIGAVGFVGLATIFKSINESNNGKILPGIGAGIRVMASKETNFNVGMDIAKGINDWSLSFRIGEAF